MAQAGVRFERYVRDAMNEADLNLADLARDSGVKETNWHGWFRGEHQPRRNSLMLAANVLNRTPDQLLAVWDGDRPHKSRGATETGAPLVEALHAQTKAINDLVALLADADLPARVAAMEPVVARLAERVLEGSPEPTARRGTGG